MPKGKRKVQSQEEVEEEVQDNEEGTQGTTVTATVSSGYPVIDVEEIEGVGRVTAQKLREAGYLTARDVAFASVKELAEILGSEDRAKQIIMAAQKLIGL
ncbi:MAG: helix-hairpin-helix domain-containing protein, partial [Vulcanisaeta sp.]|nr:helix-hairpin-helix domain-containing protein [Vulcanisaeta sp.]